MLNEDLNALDLNNPKNVFSISKLCENKAEYLEYYAKVATAFKQDCENFLLAFAACEDVSFKTFANIWQQLSFSLVFVGQEFFSELPIFAESCFSIIKKYIIFSTNMYIQVGAVYLLYGVYSKQLSKEVVRIRLTSDEYSTLTKLVDLVYLQPSGEDFMYVFRMLDKSEAFHLTATIRYLGLESKFTTQERKLKNDIFKNTLDSDPISKLQKVLFLDESCNLMNLNKICSAYEAAIQNYAASTSTRPLAIHQESHVVQKVEDLFKQLQHEFKQPPQNNESGVLVAERRKAIRDKAFQNIKQEKHF